MLKGWVFDSSPLIILGKIKALNLLESLPGSVVIPVAVAEELGQGRASDPARLWVKARKKPAKKVVVPSEIASWDLGRGEKEVISYARAHPGHVAVLDDRLARNCAAGLLVPTKGTVGLLLWLKKKGKLEKVKPYLDQIAQTDFWIAEALHLEALRLAGED